MFINKPPLPLLLALSVLLAACYLKPTPASPTPRISTTQTTLPSQKPVILHIGWLTNPDTLNPAYAFLEESYTIFHLTYGTLVTEAPSSEYVGDLAKEWTHTDDGLIWTFTLKDDIKWQDGIPFKAADIEWFINTLISNPSSWATLSSYTAGFKEVKAIDNKTLQITLENPISNLEYRLSMLYNVYPKDFQQFKTDEELQNFNNFNLIGTGPYKLTQYKKDQGILILDANPDYYDGKPAIDQIIFQSYDNVDAMLQALKVGELDMLVAVPQSAFETVQNLPNITAIATPSRDFTELIINSVPTTHTPAPKRNPTLEDPQVRLALATAINKKDLVSLVLLGFGEPGDTIVPPTLGRGFWHNPNIQDIAFDLDKANQILDNAGYVLGSDGFRSKEDVPLEFRLQYPADNPLYPRVSDLITSWFKQIGVKINPEAVQPDTLTAAVIPEGDFDLVIREWSPDPDPDFILSVMTTNQFVEGGRSDSGYSNAEYDQLYHQQQTVLDRKARQQIIWRMQELVFNDRPSIVLWYSQMLQAYRSDRFAGFITSPRGIEAMLSILSAKPVK